MTTKTKPFLIDEYLETDEDIKAFLTDMAENGTPDEFIGALGVAAKAKGMTAIAKQAGVSRASLYKSLSEDGKPKFETIDKIVHALGFKLTIQSL